MATDPSPAKPSRRPGFGLRIALYLLLCLLVLQIGSSVLLPLFDPAGFEEARARGDLEPFGLGVLLATQAVLAPVIVVVTIVFLHFVDHRLPSAIGGGWPPPRRRALEGVLLVPPILLGAWALMTTVLADLRVAGWAVEALEGPGGLRAHLAKWVLYAVGFLAASVAQEWMLRGYVYSTVRRHLAWIHAAGLTAIFQVLLQWTPRIEPAGLINVFLLALGFGALRELSGSVWPAAIFSGVWNTVLGGVLSLPISGLEAPRSFEVELTGDVAWTGGSWGPEGSWSMTSLLLVLLVLLVRPLAERDAPSSSAEA